MTPENQQFCLRWNNYQTNLTQVFEQLLHAEKFVDVTLACEGNSLKAHRMVLSSCSTYFQNVLSESPCSHPVIILQGVKWLELKAIVEFMYKGEVNINQDQLSSVLRVGESLKIRGLAEVNGEGGESEAFITSPSESPRVSAQFWSGEEAPRKRRRLSGADRSRSRTPSPRMHTPHNATELLEASIDQPSNLSRGSSVHSNPTSLTSLPSPSPVASLASSLSSLVHLQGPMPPPGPPLPPHLAHLPPLSPLSPLLNMHPMPRHLQQDDFEIRPGIAEMIREEERAKLLESTHHWISNPMADSYQAQVQAAWQKSWNQTQSLLQNLRFRERGPLKSWRPETMADAIHSVLREGLSLSQAARKYDIPYPTFVLYANRVHNLLGPSHEPGDLRPKGRGRPQRILLGSWPEDQIKGVIRAVVFRDTAVLRDNDHKENKHPATAKNSVIVKDEASKSNQAPIAGPVSSNRPSTERSTPNLAQPSTSGSMAKPATNGPSPLAFNATIKSESPNMSAQDLMNSSAASIPSLSPQSHPPSVPMSNISPNSTQSRPSSTTSSTGQANGHAVPISPTGSSGSGNSHANFNGGIAAATPSLAANAVNGSAAAPKITAHGGVGGLPPPQRSLVPPHRSPGPPHGTPNHHHQQRGGGTAPYHSQHQIRHHNSMPPRPVMPHVMSSQQQLLGLISGGMPNAAALGASSPHMARLFSEGVAAMTAGRVAQNQNALNSFHLGGYPRPGHPGMIPPMGMLPGAGMASRPNAEEQDLSPEAILFGKTAPSERIPYGNPLAEAGMQPNMNSFSNPTEFNNPTENISNPLENQILFRDALETIKSEPEAIAN